jgi:single-strand DNA-binding protein
MLSTKKNPENNAPIQQQNPPTTAAPKTVAPEENDDLPF